MSIELGLILKSLSDRLRELPGVHTFDFSDGEHSVVIRDIDSDVRQRAINIIREERHGVASYTLGFHFKDEVWQDPPTEWLAAILRGDDVASLTENNVIDPPCPRPCIGIVPLNETMDIEEVPSGHTVGVDCGDRIHSRKMCEFLMAHDEGDLGKVSLNGSILDGWSRFNPRKTCRVIDVRTIGQFQCLACGTKVFGDHGVWVGNPIESSVARDETGIGHLGAIHPIVLSIDVASEMERKTGTGFALSPVIDSQCPTGQCIVDVIAQLEPLRICENAQTL